MNIMTTYWSVPGGRVLPPSDGGDIAGKGGLEVGE